MPRQPGGGIYGYSVQGTVAALLGSAVVNNTASSGDGGILGILNSGSPSITNSTLSANSATSSGGAISTMGGLTVSFSTISAHSARSGGGIAALTGAITTLKATFLAGNAATSGPDCAGTVTSLGDNLIGDADGCSGVSAAGDLTGSDASPLDPRLGALADNGGPTMTQALLPGSPALDAVPMARPAVESGPPHRQRALAARPLC